MLDVLNRYAHGFVVLPLVIASRRGDLFSILKSGPATADQICKKLNANSGHLQVALRLFQSLGWIDVDSKSRYCARPELKQHELIPDDLWALLDVDMDAYLREGSGGFLRPYLQRSANRWDLNDDLIADFCDSMLVIPVLALLAKHKNLDGIVDDDFSILPTGVRDEVIDLLLQLKWLERQAGQYLLTPSGEFMFDRAMNLGVAESYRPMLLAMDELLFGDAEAIFISDENGDEAHVDRSLNVIASGFMHDRFFAEVEEALISIFSREPLSEQPQYVADMGSGDGTFLKRVFETVRDKTPRGKHLKDYPLTLIGIDLNQASLDETSQTLADIEHIVVAGDIGDPHKVIEDIKKLGVDPESILHIRSFLDHDRPYIEPTDTKSLSARAPAHYLGVYVDRRGRAITPQSAVQSLVEHLGRWCDVVTAHGFILLEVHCQDPLVVREFLDQSESLYFDAIEGFSHQLLVEADVALMSAAEAGLFPQREYFRKFPGVLPYCRITLNLFERRPYKVRMAQSDDLEELLHLEETCWPKEMRVPRKELGRRIDEYPLGQWVLELDGEIAGVVYTQRIDSIESLYKAKLSDIGAFHNPTGNVVQLLGLNVLPEMQHLGLGDQLLDLLLMRSALQGGIKKVTGLTRCKDFTGETFDDLAAYIDQRDSAGRPTDPILQFHHKHGATFLGPVKNYRPEDKDNLGAGVLLCYDFSSPGTGLRSPELDAAIARLDSNADARSKVESCLRTVLGPSRQDAFAWKRSLRDIGLDSLSLLEFRTLLQQTFDRPLSPTFFFSHPTPETIVEYLEDIADSNAEQRTETSIPVDLTNAVRGPELAENKNFEPQISEKIAIVGMAGRFPGASNLVEYWDLLANGKDAISEIPTSRWDVNEFYSNDPDAPGKMNSKFGGFLDGVDKFDAAFFDISPNEARLMDPQQRLLMEIHWEALENAGINPDHLRETRCGIFVGLYSHDYELLQVLNGDDDDLGAYYATGNSASIAAGRIAYYLGTRGPALTIDTACSSSLVAVHQAVQSIRSGQSNIAIASGVSLILSPRLSIIFSKAGMLAADGRCKTFDAAADGYVRSEGCCAIVLKKLSEAQRDGDRILAVLRGSAINQDGASNGLTAPNLLAQEDLLRDALRDADLRPADIDFIEAHGTGTSLGDPVEFAAIRNVYGDDPARGEPLLLGSVKTNIGHTEAASGLAGVIKAVLAMEHESVPAHLHFNEANTLIDLDEIPATIPTNQVKLKNAGHRLRAGVSSFGFSGTNAHVILEQAESASRDKTVAAGPSSHILTLSAKSESALRELAERYVDWLPEQDDDSLADICLTTNRGRAHHSYRLAAIGGSRDEIITSLNERLSQPAGNGTVRQSPKIAFLFTGQGSQYIRMARELSLTEPTFRNALAECQTILANELEYSLEEILYPTTGTDLENSARLDDTAYTQPALFAVEYALARMLQAWGVEPDAVMGHSVGEYVAACIAGVFSLEDGLKLIAARGRLMGALPVGGVMYAVLGDKSLVIRALEGNRNISVAAYNGPENIVISGPEQAVKEFAEELENNGLKVLPLQVSHAFHSNLMEPAMPAFREAARWVTFSKPALNFVSNVSGTFADEEVLSADYWASHIREPVRFEESIHTLLDSGIDVMIEVGPHSVLSPMGQLIEAAPSSSNASNAVLWTSIMSRDLADWSCVNSALKLMYERGADIDWSSDQYGLDHSIVTLPNYPWQRKTFWFEDGNSIARLSGSNGRSEFEQANVLYQPQWIAQSRLDVGVSERQAVIQPDGANLVAIACAERNAAHDRYRKMPLRAKMDEVCCNFVIDTLRNMGWAGDVGDTLTAHQLIERYALVPRYERLLSRLLQILAEEGFLEWRDGIYRVVRKLPVGRLHLAFPEIGLPECDAEYRLFDRCARNLLSVLKGDTDPLELIFPDGGLDDAVAVYTKSPFATISNVMVQSAVGQIVDELPAGQTIRILEIGAGTGGTTFELLPLLPKDRTEYIFTDVSDVFLDEARDKFSAYPFVRYERFDVEQDSPSQGLAEYQFDLVIAANVIHATKNLRTTISNAAKMLSPGGALLLVEGVEKTRWIDMVFGLTEGWWRFEDVDLRPDYPLLNSDQWETVLRECGMESVDIATTTADSQTRNSPADLFNQAIVVARAGNATSENNVSLPPGASDSCHWIVLADQSRVGEYLARYLEEQGDSCELIYLNESPVSLVDSCSVATAGDLCGLFESHVDTKRSSTVRVVDLWPLDIEKVGDSESNPVESVTACGLQLIETVRAAARADFGSFLVVTNGSRPVHTADEIELNSATLAGLSNVAWAEYPNLGVRQLDLDSGATVHDKAASLYSELVAPENDMRVAYRAGQRFVQMLSPVIQQNKNFECNSDGNYLIVGGMGDLGMYSARWLVEHGARKLVLAGRSAFPTRANWDELAGDPIVGPKVAIVRELEAAGANVQFEMLDVCDKSQVEELISRLRKAGPINGVIQAAAVISDQLIEHVTYEDYQTVLGPKIAGTSHLLQSLAGHSLDFFVFYSSIGSVVGLPGQASYAAANAYLDALAHQYCRDGTQVVSINWCGWLGTGLARTAGGKRAIEELELVGIRGLEANVAVAQLGTALTSDSKQIVTIPLNLSSATTDSYSGIDPQIVQIRNVLLSAKVPADIKQQPIAAAPLFDSVNDEHLEENLEALVISTVAELLDIGPADVHLESSLGDMGMDSLLGLEFRKVMQSRCGIVLSATLAWNFPTIGAIVTHIAERLAQQMPGKRSIDSTTPITDEKERFSARSTSDIDEISDEDALRELVGENGSH